MKTKAANLAHPGGTFSHPAHCLMNDWGYMLPHDGTPVTGAEFSRIVDANTTPHLSVAMDVACIRELPGMFSNEAGICSYEENQ